jgi:TPR repeat protein
MLNSLLYIYLCVVALSVWLNLGRGGPVDKERAFRLCTELALLGHSGAVFNLGVYYMSGQGVPADFNEAARWFERAAEIGVVHGALNLAKMYTDGVGVTRDLVKAEAVLRRFTATSEECRLMHEDVVARMKSGVSSGLNES